MTSTLPDIKAIIKSPEILKKQLTPELFAPANNLLDEYKSLKKTAKSLKKEQGILSAQIGQLKKSGEPVDHVVSELKIHSQKSKQHKQQMQECEQSLLKLFEKTIDTSSSLDSTATLQPKIVPLPDNWIVEIRKLNINDSSASSEWNKLLHDCPGSSFYHYTTWASIIKKSFGHDAIYLAALNQNNVIIGLLPLIHMRSRLFGNFMVSMPYFNYGGAVSRYAGIDKLLMASAEEYAHKLGCSHIEFRNQSQVEGYPSRTNKVNLYLDLPDNTDKLWNSFTKKLRAQIKRPQRENTKIENGGIDLLDDFYRVFSENMRDLGTPVYGKDFFRNILSTCPEQAHLIIVYLDDKPVSAGFLMAHGDMLEIPWASTLRRVNHQSINMLLYWSVLQYAIENGFKLFDFGRSSKDAGTYRFKRQWGAEPHQLYWQYFLPDGEDLPSLNPNNPKYALFIALWKRLPLFIANRLGPHIVKNIP